MEVKQFTKVLVWDRNKCPENRGFLYMEVSLRSRTFLLQIYLVSVVINQTLSEPMVFV